jgi:ABC-type lipopolysaccharide export system ATPase subunit
MDLLTVKECFDLFARLRGVRVSDIPGLIKTISSLFLLDPFRHHSIEQLSGGTRRRLHAALALLGKWHVLLRPSLPPISTGQDPQRWPFSMNQRRVSIPMLDNKCKRSSPMP